MTKNLYLISQNKNNAYDTYDSAVVCARTALEAQNTHPGSIKEWFDDSYAAWSWTKPEFVSVTYLGKADETIPFGVVCASFNAG